MTLQNFTISSLAPSVGCFNGFPSTAQHVTRNIHGTFYVTVDAPYAVVTGYPNSFQIWRDTGSGPTSVWSSGALNTNMMILESFSTGELYAIYPDSTGTNIFVVYWADISVSTTPTTTLTIASVGTNGKLGSTTDEARRMLFIFGNFGWICRVSDTATLLGKQQIYSAVTDQPHYIGVHMDTNGYLYCVFGNAFSGTDYDYTNAALCINPGDIGGVTANSTTSDGFWSNGTFINNVATPPLTLPQNPGFNGLFNYMTSGDDYRGISGLLLSSAVRNGRLRACNAQWKNGIAGFSHDDLRDISLRTFVSRWQNPGFMLQKANIIRPLRDPLSFARSASASWHIRAPGDFLVTMDRDSLVCWKSIDLGASWSVYAKTAIPGLGTDTPHYIACSMGPFNETDIVGMFTVLHCTPSQWATGTIPVPPGYAANNPTASAFTFSLPVS